MAILVTADLHLDQWLADGRDPLASINSNLLAGLDALIIAGDLSNKPKVRWGPAIGHLSRYIDPSRIYLIPGNHDYYQHCLDDDDRLGAIAAAEGANFAQKTEMIISDMRFLCCTMWTDFQVGDDAAYAQIIALRRMNDYRYIRMAQERYRRIRPFDTVAAHVDQRNWLEGCLAKPFAGRTVVVTHHCPLPNLIGEQRDELDPAYGTDQRDLMQRFRPDNWFYGHTHHKAEEKEGKTMIRNISLGYPDEVPVGQEAGVLLRGMVDTKTVR